MGTKIDKDEKKRIKAEAKANAKAKKAATEKVKTKKFSFMKKNCKKKGSSSFKWKMFFKNPATGKKGLSFVSRIAIVIIIPVLVASTIITVFDTNALTKGLTDSAYEGLEGIAKCVTAGYNTADESNYYVSNNKHLRKGHYDLTERLDVIDSYAADEDLDISLYYGSTCMITSLIDPATGERVINTEAPEEVVKAVLENGQVYRDDNVKMNGHVYSVVYVPIIQDEDDIVGMVCAGRYQETISSAVNEERNKTILIELIIVAIAAVFAVIIARGFSKCITITEDSIKTMSDGDLTKPADSKVMKRTDEIGSMLVALENMRQRLTTILSGVAGYAEDIHNVSETVDNMTGQADNAVGEISKAIEDISHGAMNQADEVEDANTSMITMGSQVDDIANGVKLLDVSAANMKAASDKALAIMDELAKSTERTTDAIDLIGNQVVMTNKSVAEIRNAVNMITDIASQTNLLSLNASIEAARAGEQGKGFAVVASEIQKLSDQSNQSAITIGEIIAELGRKSEETVKEMNNAQEIVKEQQENLVLTKEKFAAVDAEIDASRREAKNIKERTDICTESKGRVVDVMSNLSALSEENAASTEETTASIQEINANINILAQNAVKLNELAAKLVEGIRYFKLS